MTTTMARQSLTIDTRETINGSSSSAVFEKCHASRCQPPRKPSSSTEAAPERFRSSSSSSKHQRRRRTRSSSSSRRHHRRRGRSTRRSSSPSSSSSSSKKTQRNAKNQPRQQSPRRNDMPTYEEIKMWSIVSVSAGDSVLAAGGKSQTAKEVTDSVLRSLRKGSSQDDEDRTMVAAEASTAILAAGGCKYLAMAAMVMILTNYEMGDEMMPMPVGGDDGGGGEEEGRDKREERDSSGVVRGEMREGIDCSGGGEYSREMIDRAGTMMDDIHSPSSRTGADANSSNNAPRKSNYVIFSKPPSPTSLNDCRSPRLLPRTTDGTTTANPSTTRSFDEPTKPLTNPSIVTTSQSLSFEKQTVKLNPASWSNVRDDIRDLRRDDGDDGTTRTDDKSTDDTSGDASFDDGVREELLSHYLKGYGEGAVPDASLFDEILKMRFTTEGDDTTTTTHSTSGVEDGAPSSAGGVGGAMPFPPLSPIAVSSLRSVTGDAARPRHRECLMHIARDIWTSIRIDDDVDGGEFASERDDERIPAGFEEEDERSSVPPPSSTSSSIVDDFDDYSEISSIDPKKTIARSSTVATSNPSSYAYDFSDLSLKPPKGSFSRRSSLTKVTRRMGRNISKLVDSQKKIIVSSQKKLMTTSHRWNGRQCSSLGSLP